MDLKHISLIFKGQGLNKYGHSKFQQYRATYYNYEDVKKPIEFEYVHG